MQCLPPWVRILTHPSESRENEETQIEVLMAAYMLNKPFVRNINSAKICKGGDSFYGPKVILFNWGIQIVKDYASKHMIHH